MFSQNVLSLRTVEAQKRNVSITFCFYKEILYPSVVCYYVLLSVHSRETLLKLAELCQLCKYSGGWSQDIVVIYIKYSHRQEREEDRYNLS